MKTVEKIRFSVAAQQAVKSELSLIVGHEILELDTNAPIGLGSFSKARSKIESSIYNAIYRACDLLDNGCKSDLLLRYVENWHRIDGTWKPYHGWQVFERRMNKSRRVCTPAGSYMPKKSCGFGRIFIM